MKKLILLLFVLSSISCYVRAQYMDFGMGYGPGYSQQREKKKKDTKPDPYMQKISAKLNQNYAEIAGYHEKGYGRIELIKLILISQQSNQPMKKLVESRNKKTTLTAMAKKYNLDYTKIHEQAYKLKDEIEKELKTEASLVKSTDTAPGNVLGSSITANTELKGSSPTLTGDVIKSTETQKSK